VTYAMTIFGVLLYIVQHIKHRLFVGLYWQVFSQFCTL